MVKGANTLEGDKALWTATTVQLPSLLYVDYIWDDGEKDRWLTSPHWQRLDMLNARAGVLDLDDLTMPISLTFEVDNYDNVRIYEGLAPINLYYNSSGYTYLGFTADMATHMQSATEEARGAFWQAPKDVLTQFNMTSGHMGATRLQSMYKETRPETLWFLRTLIKEAIKGHNEWVSNGGYTIEGDIDLGPSLAAKFQEAVHVQDQAARGISRLEQLRDITGDWDIDKRISLQKYLDIADEGTLPSLSRFMVFDEGWSKLTQEEKGFAIELWTLENKEYRAGSDEDDNDDNGNGGIEDSAGDARSESSDLVADLPTAHECTDPGSNAQCDNPACLTHG